MENIKCNITEENHNDNLPFNYDEIVSLVDNSIEEKNINENNDMMEALKVFYNENYTKKELEKIAEYYFISKRKKRKIDLVKAIVKFETNEENIFRTQQRKTMWFYIDEIENDEIMNKYLIF